MATPLLDWIEHLMRDPNAREAFQKNPDHYAQQHGFAHLASADVHDALSLIADGHHSHHGGSHYPAPRHWAHGGHGHGDHDGTHYLRSYFHDNHSAFQRHDSDVDNSVHQHIETGGRDHHWHDGWNDGGWHDAGNFNQTLDNDPVVASGDGAVAARHGIHNSTVTSGHRNLIGNNNQATTGGHNTTAFGTGDATNSHVGHLHGGSGSSVSFGGESYGHNSENRTHSSVHNSGDGHTSVNVAGAHGYSDQYADQSDHDHSQHSDYEDHSRTIRHEELDSHNSGRYADSHDTDVHHH